MTAPAVPTMDVIGFVKSPEFTAAVKQQLELSRKTFKDLEAEIEALCRRKSESRSEAERLVAILDWLEPKEIPF